jgi:FMN phosphatase YigB (HAD superfamily)/glycosyltransferase involved in cell wall biosynthesis
VKELLHLDGEEFVNRTYVTLFRRLPDTDGLVNQLIKISDGNKFMRDSLRHQATQLPHTEADEEPTVHLQEVSFLPSTSNREGLDPIEGSLDGLDGIHDSKREDSVISAELFDETGYLSLHSDVQEAIERGDVKSGYKHYDLYGRAENRALPVKLSLGDQRRRYFDEEFYRRRYSVEENGFEHYCYHGWKMGNMPNPLFSPKYYANHHGVHEQEPLLHFLENWRTCSFVSPVFDIRGYLKRYSDLADAHTEPFLHFILQGISEGRAPGFPLFDIPERKRRFAAFDWECAGEKLGVPLERIDGTLAQAYVALVDEYHYQALYGQALIDCSAAEHYAVEGRRLDLWPNPFFDTTWYAACHGVNGLDPIWHHLLTSARPTPFFCAKSYLQANVDIGKLHTEQTAFSHFVAFGANERRSLGLTPEHLSAVRKIESDYDWRRAAAHYEFPAGLENRPDPLADGGTGLVLSPPRPEADSFQTSLVLRKARSKKVVSFDIWDTVLRRACDPDEVKFYAACVLLRSLQRSGASVELTAVEVFRLRQLAEFRVADEHYEYSHGSMVREWLSLCGVRSPPQAELLGQQVAEAEIAREIAITRVDPTMMAILEALPKTRKIAISDFYFPSEVLRRILAHHRVDKHFEAIYVSCDFIETKRAGALFDEVLRREAVSAGDLLHVGDNAKADYEVPLKRGIDAFHFSDRVEEKRKEYLRAYLDSLLAGDGEIMTERTLRDMFGVAGSAVQGSSDSSGKPAVQVAIKKDISAQVRSVDLLALIFAGFGLFILEKALAAKTEKIFFATREGEFFRRVYDLLAARDVLGAGRYPSSAIIEVSRRATFAASLRSISIEEMMRLWSMYSVQSMKAFGKSLNLDAEQLAAFCERYGLQLAEPLEFPWQDERVNLLFEDSEFQGWLSSESLRQREGLWNYLERIGFEPAENKTRLIVDIGWRGSIQDNLAFLVNGRLEGVYLALYKYVAEQPLNARKFGFLANHNRDNDAFHVGDFAPLEFITNSCGGSVTGYKNGKAVRDVFPTEEQLIATEILPVQDAILAKIDALVPVLLRSPLTWAGRWGLIARQAVKRYMERPDLEIADIFQRLEHNETFGAGEIQNVAEDGDGQLGSLAGAELHSVLVEKLRTHRWPQAWLRSLEGKGYFNELSLDRKLMLPRVDGFVRAPALVRCLGYKISIYAPEPLRGSGGHRTIYNLAKALDASGFTVHLFSERRGNDYAYKEEELAGSSVKLHNEWFSGIIPDAAFATIQYSSSYLTQFFDHTVKKFFFVQDFEAEFNPVSDNYVRGQNSFTEGHNHICIGRWLTHRLRAEYGCGAASAGLGVDTTVYRPLEDVGRLNRIAVLFQPEKWRRLPEHCLEALAKVKARRPQTEIVFYGSRSSPNAAFRCTNLGLINDLNELNRLYNSALVGLCISLTNPSRIPYEMMAAGCVPVDVYRYNNLFDYENGTGMLAYQSAESLAQAILHLLEHGEELASRREKCIATVAHRTLTWETDAAVNATEHVLEGGVLNDIPQPSPSYTDQPFIAEQDDRPPVRAWCSWQKRLSDMR